MSGRPIPFPSSLVVRVAAAALAGVIATACSQDGTPQAAAAEGARPEAGPPAPDDGTVPPFLVVKTGNVDGAIVPREFMELRTDAVRYAREGMPDLGAEGYWTPSVAEVTVAQVRVRAAMSAASRGEVAGVFGDAPVPERRSSAPQAIAEIVGAWDEYRVQYLGLVESGRRRILCNAFPKADAPGSAGGLWMFRWVATEGGGSWYWRIRYDVASDTCLGFDCNAP
ncbi:MAG TPA: hypothetical protein VK824_04995 [Planctomycetota bacterium]|nr:hypothetical protein [Planctomycetota bacterium]